MARAQVAKTINWNVVCSYILVTVAGGKICKFRTYTQQNKGHKIAKVTQQVSVEEKSIMYENQQLILLENEGPKSKSFKLFEAFSCVAQVFGERFQFQETKTKSFKV